MGEALQGAASAALETTRADYQSYAELRAAGQLPTLIEEVEAALPDAPKVPDAIAKAMPELSLPALPGVGGSSSVLGALQAGSDPVAQRTQLQRRREYEAAMAQLRLAAAVGDRAAKDSGDALVFGVLPAATAVSKVASRRVADLVSQRLADSRIGGALPSLPAAPPPPPSGASAASGTAGLVRDVAAQLAVEYADAAQRGRQQGLLPDMRATVTGETRRLVDRAVSRLPSGVLEQLGGP